MFYPGFQIEFGAANTGNTTAGRFLTIDTGGNAPTAGELQSNIWALPRARISDFWVGLGAALATSNITFALRLNGVSVATVTLLAGVVIGSSTGLNITINPGDLLAVMTTCSIADNTASHPKASIGFN